MSDGRGQNELAALLGAAQAGDRAALDRAAAIVDAELRSIASRMLRGERSGQTLRTTALVNEAYVRLMGDRAEGFEGRSHFLGTAARAMRSIVVDYARARAAQKRGGGWKRVPLDEVLDRIELDRLDLLSLEEALARLEARSDRQARVVELRFFAGLSIAEAATVLGVSHGTVETDWRLARAWLHRELGDAADGETEA